MLNMPRSDLLPNQIDYERVPLLQASGFREYDARWLFENPAQQPLHIIEVQIGSYTGENDIERIDDIYGRN